MTYQETIDYLYRQLPMYQRQGKSAYKKNLTNTHKLMRLLGDPHKRFKSVHIAGTNGKGTCAHGIASVLQLSGYKTGLYTSPHLKDFTERIKIGGKDISNDAVIRFVKDIRSHIDVIAPSFFELTVAMAFDHFARENVDIAVIETGLGGRLDSTNIITPEACLITNIGLDHTDILGGTLEEIAHEKAGIIKNGVPVVIGKYQDETFPVFIEHAKQNQSRIFLDQDFGWEEFPFDYPFHKIVNRKSVYSLAYVIREQGWKIAEEDIHRGFDNLEKISGLKGRFQTIKEEPKIIADVSHNADGLKLLFEQVISKVEARKSRLFVVFGTVKDKPLESILTLIPRSAHIFWTQASVPRSLPAKDLEIEASKYGLTGHPYTDVNAALTAAESQAHSHDIILVTGSTFVVAELDSI